VASKTGGFVAMMTMIYVGFFNRPEAWQPILWVLAALSMTVGNLIALRQTNIVRMLAYSSIAQGGFMLVPFAVASESASAKASAFEGTVVYLLIYAAMNLGAFAALIAIARKTRSGDITSFSGLYSYAPGLAITMSVFLFSLAGIPPLGGWYAKLVVFKAIFDAGNMWAVVLGVVAALNSVIALFYYAGVSRMMWFREAPEGVSNMPRSVTPPALGAAMALPVLLVLGIGVYPQLVARVGELASLFSS
jgi:NADH-quinone oxidoreductase subunit N